MPELPDVEGFRRVLADHGVGARIDDVDVADAGVLRNVDAEELRRALSGMYFDEPRRHGKWLVAPTRFARSGHQPDDPSLVFHFGMTGGLVWADRDGDERHRHDRIVLVLSNGELRYRDMRKLQGVRLSRTDADVGELLGNTGPDAFDLTPAELGARLAGLRRQLKPALMDQEVVAGLGNLLVDEILWRSHLHPARPTTDLSRADRDRMHRRMRTVLRNSVAVGHVPGRSSWLTGNREKEGAPCPHCGTPLRHSRIGGRTTVWCPHCQER